LCDNIRMADYTAIGHSGCLPECGMASRAIATKFGMRANPTENCPSFGIQLTRTEKRTTEHQFHDEHDKAGQQGCYQARNSQAAKWFRLHISPYLSRVA